MSGSPRKPPGRRQGHTTRDLEPVVGEVVSLAGGPADTPLPDREWLTETKRLWADLWGSPLAEHFQETDLASLRRCFMWRDELTRSRRRARAIRRQAEDEAVVEGSKGQPVANPLFKVAAAFDGQALAIESKVVALEDRLGLSPKARLGLGLTQAKGMNLVAQNARLAQAIQEAMRDGAPDPRALPGDAAVDAG